MFQIKTISIVTLSGLLEGQKQNRHCIMSALLYSFHTAQTGCESVNNFCGYLCADATCA